MSGASSYIANHVSDPRGDVLSSVDSFSYDRDGRGGGANIGCDSILGDLSSADSSCSCDKDVRGGGAKFGFESISEECPSGGGGAQGRIERFVLRVEDKVVVKV